MLFAALAISAFSESVFAQSVSDGQNLSNSPTVQPSAADLIKEIGSNKSVATTQADSADANSKKAVALAKQVADAAKAVPASAPPVEPPSEANLAAAKMASDDAQTKSKAAQASADLASGADASAQKAAKALRAAASAVIGSPEWASLDAAARNAESLASEASKASAAATDAAKAAASAAATAQKDWEQLYGLAANKPAVDALGAASEGGVNALASNASKNPTKPGNQGCALSASGSNSNVACKFQWGSGVQKEDFQKGEGWLYSLGGSIPQVAGNGSSQGTPPTPIGTTNSGLANAYSVTATLGRVFSPKDENFLGIIEVAPTFGWQSYTYFSSGNLAKETGSEHVNGLDVSFVASWHGYVPIYSTPTLADGHNSASLDFKQANSYKDATSKIECPVGTANVVCVSGPIGPPTHQATRAYTLEYSHLFDTTSGRGISVSFGRNWVKGVKTVDVPIYLYTWNDAQNKPALSFGLDLTWTDDATLAHKGSIALIFTSNVQKLLTGGK